MLAGIQEIFTILLIIVCIIFVPRLFRAKEPQTLKIGSGSTSGLSLSWKMRLGIVLSFIWPVVAGLFFRPWESRLPLFVAAGFLPVAAGWAFLWIFNGVKRR
ncbi:conserved membrane hypothetical protein [Desulfamplus magnetovallimortis]|uniref:Uncharacterized protein n=1 Tax=Desulfamplus magnetovallimortis TaxID=1246637 RepID=A0A1W1HDF0_9BACT|nr:hypothetical protein [Desulfamplus magnetovallimortis]SLM30517.1 conserved membrane hypothetical protein [Desulfamplus magnetovallimortis]